MASANDIKARFHLWGEDIRGAMMFLTRLPVGGPPLVMPRGFRAFPVAGAAIGIFGAVVLAGAMKLGFSPLTGAIASLVAMTAITGALHEDGLADTADGFGGGGDVEHKLKIMADSRLGTYGTVTLILTLGLRAALLAELAGFLNPPALIFALAAAAATGRAAPVFLFMALPPARPGGLGAAAGRPDAVILFSAVAAMSALLLPVLATMSVFSVVLAVFISANVIAALCRLSSRQIGGQTGDVAGAAVILTETGFLAGLAL